ncbi:hypothetical protein LNP74_29130 [Klebsiella pneumoniae subsp. pneumoniae]|nr:hypothetical protein [Klebsiella pneumoniae subsp. pneumoniae]
MAIRSGQAANVELSRRIVAFHQLADFVLQARLLVVKLQQRARMNANHAVDDEIPAAPDRRLRSAGGRSRDARSGLPTFIITFGSRSGMSPTLELLTLKSSSSA